MKRHEGTLNAYCSVKEVSLKTLPTTWFRPSDTLEKGKTVEIITDQCLPGVWGWGGTRRDERGQGGAQEALRAVGLLCATLCWRMPVIVHLSKPLQLPDTDSKPWRKLWASVNNSNVPFCFILYHRCTTLMQYVVNMWGNRGGEKWAWMYGNYLLLSFFKNLKLFQKIKAISFYKRHVPSNCLGPNPSLYHGQRSCDLVVSAHTVVPACLVPPYPRGLRDSQARIPSNLSRRSVASPASGDGWWSRKA